MGQFTTLGEFRKDTSHLPDDTPFRTHAYSEEDGVTCEIDGYYIGVRNSKDKGTGICISVSVLSIDLCQRCDSRLVDGLCQDETCPFSEHDQECPAGWAGHSHPPVEIGKCDCKKYICKTCLATVALRDLADHSTAHTATIDQFTPIEDDEQ